MFHTPLKNSKNVNKPFKSPFGSSPNNNLIQSVKKKDKQNPIQQSPLSSKTLETKRILKLDDDEPQSKKLKLPLVNKEKVNEIVPEDATKTDLIQLKRKIFEMRQELDRFKSRERCTKKHDPKDLRASIVNWRSACQNALEIISKELTERNGKSSSISDVLKMLGIPEDIVRYSESQDMFID